LPENPEARQSIGVAEKRSRYSGGRDALKGQIAGHSEWVAQTDLSKVAADNGFLDA